MIVITMVLLSKVLKTTIAHGKKKKKSRSEIQKANCIVQERQVVSNYSHNFYMSPL